MIDHAFLSSDLLLVTLTVGLYCLGGAIYRRTHLPLLHPVLLTFVAVVGFLKPPGHPPPPPPQAPRLAPLPPRVVPSRH